VESEGTEDAAMMQASLAIFYSNASVIDEGGVNGFAFDVLDNSSSGLDANSTRDSFVPYEQRLATYIVPAVFTLIFIIGVLGNGCLILIFFRHRAMRNVPNT
jgi:hypothetical protein